MLLATLLVATHGRSVPGVVIDFSPAKSRRYVGSPSLAILPNGDYVAAHDEFGPGMQKGSPTDLFRSTDRGRSWTRLPTVFGASWSNLFVHGGALYLMGPSRGYGKLVIRRSMDGGEIWSQPSVIRGDGQIHTAPVPMAFAHGRIWRAYERRASDKGWASTFEAGVVSAPENADLLDPQSWTTSNLVPSDSSWNGGDMHGWLEGNAVVAPDGDVVDVLRVDTHSSHEKAAIVRISPDGRTADFDPKNGFVDLPGGAKKFTIRYDEKSRLYWTVATPVEGPHSGLRPAEVRNNLALESSPDLVHWTIRRSLMSTRAIRSTGFQYADWLFDGDDIATVVRTAFDGAHKAHDANYLTFYRVENFRQPGTQEKES